MTSPKAPPPPPAPTPQELYEAYPYGLVLEDFTPFVDSLECRLGRTYWHRRGLQAFHTGEVPNRITNDGTRAMRSADVLFVNCEEAASRGTLGRGIAVVEMGVGLGLHARVLLSRFRSRCLELGRDYYDRLVYYATDLSGQNIADLIEHGTLAEHGDHIRFGRLDATRPDTFTDHTTGKTESLTGRVRAIFHNYVFDVLPATLLLRQEGLWFELRLQTRVTEMWRLSDLAGLTPEELKALAAGGEEDLDKLLPIYSLLRVERSFFPVDLDSVPHGRTARRFADEVMQPFIDQTVGASRNLRMVLNWGALQALEGAFDLLEGDGFLLFTDYGVTDLHGIAASRQHQRYGASVSVSVNFPLLEHFVAWHEPKGQLLKPEGDDDQSLHARLLVKTDLERTTGAFGDLFASAVFEELDRLLMSARTARQNGDIGMALATYRAAWEQQPLNWALLSEWANAANFGASQHEKAAEIASWGLDINPGGSADLWCEYGDAIYALGRYDEAHRAFLQALKVNPEHVRTHYNLAWTHVVAGRLQDALVAIGSALAYDRDGYYRQRLLDKQREIIAHRQEEYDAERSRLVHRLQ